MAARISARSREAAKHAQEQWIPGPLRFDHRGHAHHAGQRKFGIDLCRRTAQSGGQGIGSEPVRTMREKEEHGPLKKRLVDFGFVARGFRIGFHVADDADNLAPSGGAAIHVETDLFSERILVVEIAIAQTSG